MAIQIFFKNYKENYKINSTSFLEKIKPNGFNNTNKQLKTKYKNFEIEFMMTIIKILVSSFKIFNKWKKCMIHKLQKVIQYKNGNISTNFPKICIDLQDKPSPKKWIITYFIKNNYYNKNFLCKRNNSNKAISSF